MEKATYIGNSLAVRYPRLPDSPNPNPPEPNPPDPPVPTPLTGLIAPNGADSFILVDKECDFPQLGGEK